MIRPLTKLINKTLSVRLSLMIVSSMALLLLASLIVMLHYSRKAVREESLQKAAQILDGTVQHIDNILLSVEQTTGNFYFNIMPHINNPDMMYVYSRKLVESNPYVIGCAIAFEPNFYPGRDLFMAYFHRDDKGNIVQSETFANTPYTEQVWFTDPIETKMPKWQSPLSNDLPGQEPLITFSLPFYNIEGKPIGVIGVDVSLSLLTSIVLETKPSPNSYCTLLDSKGMYIVHPDKSKLHKQSVFSTAEHSPDPSFKEAAKAMVSGETGNMPFRMNGIDYYVFFKPFSRATMPGRVIGKLGWSAGIIYPEEDIFGDYNDLLYYVLAIAIVSILLIFFFCRIFIHHQLLPLRMLSEKAQLIAKGKYDEPIPDSRHKDEIGRLQNNFKQMQQSLAAHIGELEQLTEQLTERDKGLREAYHQAQKADRLKTVFLHNMTNQMIEPSSAINKSVVALCGINSDEPGDQASYSTTEDTSQLIDDIQANGDTIAELLNNLIRLSDETIRKEAANV